jgi:hypothetical protein
VSISKSNDSINRHKQFTPDTHYPTGPSPQQHLAANPEQVRDRNVRRPLNNDN